MSNKLELRMYGLVNYQLTGIQMGIQFSHVVVEYGLENFNTTEYLDWAKYWKTVIILNGGTTNSNPDRLGTLNQAYNTLLENGIICSSFSEPDLGDQMTAICFIVDERVFNKKDYPDLEDWFYDNYRDLTKSNLTKYQLAQKLRESNDPDDIRIYKKWLSLVGGEKNALLRDFLKNFRLA